MLLRLAAALIAALMLALAAQAQTYPSKTVTLVVPFPAGGSTDWLSRLLGQKLEQRLKQPFIVENRAGGANLIAATAVAKAEPDGHTLLMTTSTTMAINVSVFKNLPYDPDRDFAPVGLVSGVPFVLIVNAALPVRWSAIWCNSRNPRRAGSTTCRPVRARPPTCLRCCSRMRLAASP